MNESTVEVFRPIIFLKKRPVVFTTEGVRVSHNQITVYSNNDIVKMFQFHVPLCCLPSPNKLSDSQAKVEKLNQSPKCGYYYDYCFIPSASNFNTLVFNRPYAMESEENDKVMKIPTLIPSQL